MKTKFGYVKARWGAEADYRQNRWNDTSLWESFFLASFGGIMIYIIGKYSIERIIN